MQHPAPSLDAILWEETRASSGSLRRGSLSGLSQCAVCAKLERGDTEVRIRKSGSASTGHVERFHRDEQKLPARAIDRTVASGPLMKV